MELLLRKQQVVVGTDVPNAFVASLNSNVDLSSTSNYGIHSIPHVGVYGDSYTIALPMILLALPTSVRFLQRLPSDVLYSIDLAREYDALLEGVAKQIVQDALDAACRRYKKLLLQIAAEDECIARMAKLIVRKVLHRVVGRCESASEEWDGSGSNGDVEELVASAKRLKIMDDSPPLSASTSADNMSQDNSNSGITLSDITLTITSSCDDLDGSSESKPGKKRQRSGSQDISMMKEGEKLYTKCKEKVQNSLNEALSVSSLILDMRKMSIMEVQESEEEQAEEEDHYIVLQPVTKPCAELSETGSDRDAPIPLHPESRDIPNVECYVVVHKCPVRSACQKFMCSNTNEINILYHMWLYRDVPVDPELSVTQQVDMGVFQPRNVAPVHLDLQDGGIPFHHLEPRTVCIHNCCFSPENAQLQLTTDRDSPVHRFYSVGRGRGNSVVAYHIIPASKEVQDVLYDGLDSCGETLDRLLSTVVALIPELEDVFLALLHEFLD